MLESLRELVRVLGTLDRPVWILVIGTFINRFGSFVFVFLALYLTSKGYEPFEAGIAIGLYGIGSLFSSWAGGHLADRFPRKVTIAISMFASAIAVLALGLVESWIPILVLSTIVGAAAELYRPASSALIIDLVPEEDRVTAFALNRLALNLGMALGPMVGGFVAERSFLSLFVVDAVTSIAFGIVATRGLPAVTVRSTESKIRVSSRVLGDGSFMVFLAGAFCITLVVFQHGSTVPLHVIAAGYTAVAYGLLISVNGWMVVTCELALTLWTRRLDPALPIAGGFFLLGAGMFVVGTSMKFPTMVAGIVIFTLGEITAVPVATAWIAQLAPTALRGRYMGAWTMIWSFGLIVGPAVSMWLLQFSPTWLWRGCLLLGIAGSGLAVRAIRIHQPARTPRPE